MLRAFRPVQEDPARATTNTRPRRLSKVAAARVFLRRKPRLPTQLLASVDVGDTRDKATSRTRARCASALPERSPRRYAYPARPSRRSTATREARLRTSGWREPASRRFLTSGPRPLALDGKLAETPAETRAAGSERAARLRVSFRAHLVHPGGRRDLRVRRVERRRDPERGRTKRVSRGNSEKSRHPASRAAGPARHAERVRRAERRGGRRFGREGSRNRRASRVRNPGASSVRAARARGAGRAVPRAAQTGRASSGTARRLPDV